MFRPALSALALAVLSSGCAAGTVKGKVQDETVPGMSQGLWASVDIAGTLGIEIATTNVPKACDTFTAVYQAQADALKQYLQDFNSTKAQAAYEASEQDNLPEEYWTMQFSVTADSVGSAPGDYKFNDPGNSFVVSHVTGYTDWSHYFSDGTANAQSTTSAANAGTGTIESIETDKAASADGDADMIDEAGESAGSITFKMDGDFCQGISDLLSGN